MGKKSIPDIIIISDLHLDGSEPLLALFEQFCLRLPSDQLYILGDLFQMSFLQTHTACEKRVIAALAQLNDRGITVYFMHGNRDFLLRRGFIRKSCITLLPDWHSIKIADKNILFTHGDLLCSNDVSYQRYRRIIQSQPIRILLRILPPLLLKLITKLLYRLFKRAARQKSSTMTDVCPKTVTRIMKQWQTDILIHGHTHRPATHQLTKNSLRVCNGMWEEEKIWWIEIKDTDVTLEHAQPNNMAS